jgi:quercetin dioxygenase-like cupin family protein
MPKYRTGSERRLRLASRVAAGLLLGWCLSGPAAVAETAAPAPPAQADPGVRMVLSTGDTVTGQPIRYPSGAPARITAVEITLQPGQQTGWHTHPVPLFGYILEGELTVDYGARGRRSFRKGDGLAEAMDEAHNGYNAGREPVKILAVFIGTEGVPDTVAASPPAR